jgi:hypothetical protein
LFAFTGGFCHRFSSAGADAPSAPRRATGNI